VGVEGSRSGLLSSRQPVSSKLCDLHLKTSWSTSNASFKPVRSLSSATSDGPQCIAPLRRAREGEVWVGGQAGMDFMDCA
jgi:hypothetical protein